jgi:3-hydroxyisobutyrate dehydrogenase-like beta-hydroxyacid dehydrogenase
MRIVGIVSPGSMGSAVGAAYRAAGRRVVTTLAGRSGRTRGLAEQSALELLPSLDAVVAEAGVVLSIAPPDQALAIAADLAEAAERTGARPLVSDWNAVSPATAREVGRVLEAAGLELVDGSISGGQPRAENRTRVYLAGTRAAELADAGPAWLDLRVVGGDVGLASAVKMCTASVYKGHTALLAHALVTARAHGVLAEVLDDLHDSFPRQIDRAGRLLAVSTTKAGRYVGEMREIAVTQSSVGLTPALFEAMAEVYSRLAGTELAGEAPESIPLEPRLEDILDEIKPGQGEPGSEATLQGS